MTKKNSSRCTRRRSLGLMAAGFLFVFSNGSSAAASSASDSQAVTVESRSSSQHRRGDRYDHGRKSHDGHHGDRYRSDRYRSDRYRSDRNRSDRRSGHYRGDRHHRDRSNSRYRDGYRGRYDRHGSGYRHDRRSRYDDRYRSDRSHRYDSRYGRRYGDYSYNARRFEIPRRILQGLVHTYRDYHYGRHYYASHNHYHDIYRFPVYYETEVKYLPYAYCEGEYFATGVFGDDGPRFGQRDRY